MNNVSIDINTYENQKKKNTFNDSLMHKLVLYVNTVCMVLSAH